MRTRRSGSDDVDEDVFQRQRSESEDSSADEREQRKRGTTSNWVADNDDRAAMAKSASATSTPPATSKRLAGSGKEAPAITDDAATAVPSKATDESKIATPEAPDTTPTPGETATAETAAGDKAEITSEEEPRLHVPPRNQRYFQHDERGGEDDVTAGAACKIDGPVRSGRMYAKWPGDEDSLDSAEHESPIVDASGNMAPADGTATIAEGGKRRHLYDPDVANSNTPWEHDKFGETPRGMARGRGGFRGGRGSYFRGRGAFFRGGRGGFFRGGRRGGRRDRKDLRLGAEESSGYAVGGAAATVTGHSVAQEMKHESG